ncbi:hypothetical protein EYR40_008819 [Pleurotus pulmonarius]|nr:hypothetical protein EYR36_009640 [Pleurotus pulmonarius]KAF4594021.1 hypothetical protein EYR40_008819 [Pleurotus pulmonarius]
MVSPTLTFALSPTSQCLNSGHVPAIFAFVVRFRYDSAMILNRLRNYLPANGRNLHLSSCGRYFQMAGSERFSDIARSLQNGTHDASPEDPMLPALEDLRSEVQDIVNAFQARLRSHKQAAAELFDDKPLDTHEDDVAVEAGSDHAQAKLPVAVPSLGSHGIVEGQENRPSSDAIPPVLLGRSEDEVIAALGRAPAVQADGRSAHTESSDDTETSVTDASGTDEKLPLERQATAQVPEHVEL